MGCSGQLCTYVWLWRLASLLWAEHKFNCGLKENQEDVIDDARPGRLSTSTADENIEAVKKMVLDNRLITIREVANSVGISFSLCRANFTDLWGMKFLNFEQK